MRGSGVFACERRCFHRVFQYGRKHREVVLAMLDCNLRHNHVVWGVVGGHSQGCVAVSSARSFFVGVLVETYCNQ